MIHGVLLVHQEATAKDRAIVCQRICAILDGIVSLGLMSSSLLMLVLEESVALVSFVVKTLLNYVLELGIRIIVRD